MTVRVAALIASALALTACAGPEIRPVAAQQTVNWCSDSTLRISVSEGRAPAAADRLFAIRLHAAGSSPCTIRGMLSEVRFLRNGTEVDVPIAGGQPQETPELITVDGDREAVVYLKAPKHAPAVQVDHIRFILPGEGTHGDTVTVPWPSAVGGPVKFGIIVSPVS